MGLVCSHPPHHPEWVATRRLQRRPLRFEQKPDGNLSSREDLQKNWSSIVQTYAAKGLFQEKLCSVAMKTFYETWANRMLEVLANALKSQDVSAVGRRKSIDELLVLITRNLQTTVYLQTTSLPPRDDRASMQGVLVSIGHIANVVGSDQSPGSGSVSTPPG